MTNKEFILQNPEEMRGMLKKAKDYIENTYGYHYRMIMAEEEMLDKWLEAEHEHDQMPHMSAGKTYIANISLIMHDSGGMNIDEARQIARCIVAVIKEQCALPSFGIDDVTVGKVVSFGNE